MRPLTFFKCTIRDIYSVLSSDVYHQLFLNQAHAGVCLVSRNHFRAAKVCVCVCVHPRGYK